MEKQTVKSKLALGPLTVLQGAPVSSILHAGACLKPPLLPLCMGSLALLFGPLRLDTLSISPSPLHTNTAPIMQIHQLPSFFLHFSSQALAFKITFRRPLQNVNVLPERGSLKRWNLHIEILPTFGQRLLLISTLSAPSFMYQSLW